jgi:hypothetical protein
LVCITKEKDRFVVREEVAKELETIGALQKQKHLNKVGTSERPKLSNQDYQINGS